MLKVRRGFTIVELIITITIMGILLTLAVVNISTTQVNARDDTRKAGIDAIASSLETFFSAGAASVSTAPTLTNLFPNPEASSSSRLSFWPGVSGATTNTIRTDGAPVGNSYYRATWTTSPSSGGGPLTVDNGGSFALGSTVTTSFYIRSSIAQTYVINIQFYNGATPVAGGTPGQIYTAVANQWTRISSTQTLTGSANDIQVRAYALDGTSTIWPVGSTADITDIMQTLGPNLYDYGDGSLSGWGWLGTVGASSSAGPAVVATTPGTYPSTALTVSPLITAYLADANIKSFIAPGQTDPYATFIPATNNIQTVSGVLPQPTTNQYVYQPIDSNGNLCINGFDCRKFNLYYHLEGDNSVHKVTSRNQ